MEDSAPEGARISNQDPEGETSTVVVVKWSDKVERSGDNIVSPLDLGCLFLLPLEPNLPSV